MTQKHTPTPWKIDTALDGKPIIFADADGGHVVCQMAYERGENDYGAFTNHEINAEFIVRACNSHDDLVAALEQINVLACYGSETDTKSMDECMLEIGTAAREALAKAKEPQK